MPPMGSWGWGRSEGLLIKADGKALFAAHGIPTPAGMVATVMPPPLPGDGWWMVKAQAPVGGRGKANEIARCQVKQLSR